ncbi:MAG: hypothetical protein ACWGNI_00380 [Desulfobacterales bacterium]
MTRTEISEKTGFDSGEMFSNDAEVRDYFTIKSMKQMFGDNLEAHFPELADQDILDEMADTVIDNGWHIEK